MYTLLTNLPCGGVQHTNTVLQALGLFSVFGEAAIVGILQHEIDAQVSRKCKVGYSNPSPRP